MPLLATPALAISMLASAYGQQPAVPKEAVLRDDRTATVCQTPVNWCSFWGPASWGYSCYCYDPFGNVIGGLTNG